MLTDGPAAGDEVEWDAFFLYAPGVSWGETLPPAVTWGRPILHSKDRLRDGLRTLREDSKTREESDAIGLPPPRV